MHYKSLTEIQILNALNTLPGGYLKPGSCNFIKVPSPEYSLELSTADLQILLEPADYSLLASCPPFDTLTDPLSVLSPELKAAGIELLLTPALQALGRLLESNITVSGYIAPGSWSKVAASLSCTLCLSSGQLPCRLHLRSHEDLNLLQQYLGRLTATVPAAPAASLDPQLSISFAAGIMQLTLSELKGLQCGDALILDECSLAAGDILLLAQDLRCSAHLEEDGSLKLNGCFYKEGTEMDINQQTNSGGSTTEPAAAELTAIDELKLTAVFEIERQTFSVSQLKKLQQGSVLNLHQHDLTGLKLMINGQCAAYGRLIEAGDRYAFEITRLPE